MDIKILKRCIIILIIVIISIFAILLFFINKEATKTPDSIFKQPDEKHYDSIKYSKYNEIPYTYISNQQLCNIYLMDYKSNMIEHPEEAYKQLDEEYRNLRFGNIENFKKYIKKNEERIYNMKLSKFQVKENSKEYICLDQYNNYYIFKETAVMQYSVILDTYTIDLPEYIQKYNEATQNGKVALCIDKFIKNVNAENYTLAYNMLDKNFKNNYFKTQENFESYVKKNFLGKENIEYKNVQNEGNIYIYVVNLSSKINNIVSIEKNFNVKLGEGTNFELSFNIN